MQSRESYQRGDINNAKRNGLFAAFLTVTTIVFALLVAVIAIGLVLGVYAPAFFLEQCVSQSQCSVHLLVISCNVLSSFSLCSVK